MNLTSPANELLKPKELVPFPMPAEAFVPAVWFLGAHMLNCLLETSKRRREVLENDSEVRRSVSRARKNPKSTPQNSKIRNKTKSPAIRRVTKSNISKEVNTNVRHQRVPAREERSTSRTGKSGSKTSQHVGKESRKPKGHGPVGQAESVRQSTVASSEKTRRTSISSVSKQPPAIKDNVKVEMQSKGESLERAYQTNANGNGIASWLQNPVYSSREIESTEPRTDRSELSLPWITMKVTAPETDTNSLNKPISRRILNTVKEKSMKSRVHLKAHPIQTQQGPDKAIPSVDSSVKSRRTHQTTVQSSTTQSFAPAAFSATDIAIRKTIERKLGKSLTDVDPTSLKVLSEERMKELMQKYGKKCPPMSKPVCKDAIAAYKSPAEGETPDFIYLSADRTNQPRERLVA